MLGLSRVRLLEVVGESAAQAPAYLRQRHPLIPWRDLIDLRNLLVHAYHRVDYALIWRLFPSSYSRPWTNSFVSSMGRGRNDRDGHSIPLRHVRDWVTS